VPSATQSAHDSAAIAVAATATAVPEYAISRDDVKLYFQRVFRVEEARVNAMMSIVDHSQVKRRYCIHPIEYIIEPRPLARISEEYIEHSIRLGERVAADALGRAGIAAAEVDLLITVSCTGVMIPSLDAHLINRMGFRSDVRRLPITELGCAAGAAALGRAHDYLRAFPSGSVLVVSVELPSLTFQRGNTSQANLISSILFGDGAGAAVVTGGQHTANGRGVRLLATQSYLFPNSVDAMGFDLKETGFHIVLSRDVPQMIRERIAALVDGFLAKHHLDRNSIAAWVLHPGGQKLMCFVEEELGLGLDRARTQPSWDVLADYGNLSSASVLFVLNQWMERRRPASGAYGLLAAFGPGFSAELALLQWR
jgi:alkylresorcinol/alkylpyrone synthase